MPARRAVVEAQETPSVSSADSAVVPENASPEGPVLTVLLRESLKRLEKRRRVEEDAAIAEPTPELAVFSRALKLSKLPSKALSSAAQSSPSAPVLSSSTALTTFGTLGASAPAPTRAMQVRRAAETDVEAVPHASWRLARVAAGHLGVAKAIAVDPSNAVFATGASDKLIKIWDVASGRLRFSLQGHVAGVRGLAFSSRHAYLFSCSEDKTVKCWDLETNQVVRNYHGHTAGVYCLDVHPTVDVLVSGSRDKSVRVWDLRTKLQIHALSGHTDAVVCVKAQAVDPQIVSGGEDAGVRLWDLRAGKSAAHLTHHSKGVRALALHPKEFTFVAGSTRAVKKFAFPEGRLLQDLPCDEEVGILHSLAVNREGVLVGGSSAPFLSFWDWKSGKSFQKLPLRAQPGSLPSENYVEAAAFDVTGTRLFTVNGDKSVQTFKPVDEVSRAQEKS